MIILIVMFRTTFNFSHKWLDINSLRDGLVYDNIVFVNIFIIGIFALIENGLW